MTEQEMLLKIFSRFTDRPIYDTILENGNRYVEIALTDTHFGIAAEFDANGTVVNLDAFD